MGKRIKIPLKDKKYLSEKTYLPNEIVVNDKKYVPEIPVNSGQKGVLLKAKDEFTRNRAIKLTVYQDYQDRSYMQEMVFASKLEPYDCFAKLYDAGITEVKINGQKKNFVCFVEEWVDGFTLKDYISKESNNISISFFKAYINFMAQVLNTLKTVKLYHDDLHSGNVMVAKPPVGSINQEWCFKIIDMGSLKVSAKPTKKEKDDSHNFIQHLVEIWNILHLNRKHLSLRDRRFLEESIAILNSMLDDSLGVLDPKDIPKLFTDAYLRASSSFSKTELNSPFEFISAEHMADDRLLLEIFADSCPWLNKVNGPDPCLVTGPRGCGKSTIFRWLSLKAHLHKPLSDLDQLKISGFYISCSMDLQNRLGCVETESLAYSFKPEIIHYFNLLICREIIQTLIALKKRDDCETHWNFGEVEENAIFDFLIKHIFDEESIRIKGMTPLLRIREMIEDEMFETHSKMRRGKHLASTTPETFLGDFTTLLVTLIPLFHQKKITFLLDDFSIHRLTEPVQIILNAVIWERRSSHVFKLSAEKYGAILIDLKNATADLVREMIEIDCGREFISLENSLSKNKAKTFAVDLLDHRLKKAGYKGTVVDLLGNSPKESLAKSILDRNKKGRQNPNYYGIQRTADLCSGDAAHLLLIYRRMFEKAGINRDTVSTINSRIQHDCIVQVSRDFLDSIKSYLPYGNEMYGIAKAFGNLVRRVLEGGKDQNGTPDQCPRIEIDQKGKVVDALVVLRNKETN